MGTNWGPGNIDPVAELAGAELAGAELAGAELAVAELAGWGRLGRVQCVRHNAIMASGRTWGL